MNGKIIRKATLIVTILSGIAFCGALWYGYGTFKPMLIPALMFSLIFALVLIMEVVGALTGIKKTVSTRYKYWTQRNPVIAWIALILFLISMFSLAFHLGVWW